jgi:hypothetical protein
MGTLLPLLLLPRWLPPLPRCEGRDGQNADP